MLYLLGISVIRFTLFSKFLPVLDVLKWIYSVDFISLNIFVFYLTTEGLRLTSVFILKRHVTYTKVSTFFFLKIFRQDVVPCLSVIITWHINFQITSYKIQRTKKWLYFYFISLKIHVNCIYTEKKSLVKSVIRVKIKKLKDYKTNYTLINLKWFILLHCICTSL